MNYLIETTCKGENQVQVLKQIEKNSYRLEWGFTLKKDDEPIVLAEMYNEDCFVIANWSALIRIYSVSKKSIIFEKNIEAKISSVAKISSDQTKLFVCYQTPDYQPKLDVISLIDFSTLHSIALPSEVQTNHFTLGDQDKLLFYFTDPDQNSHGYHVLNLPTQQVTYFPMKYPQWQKFDISPPVISAQYKVGIMPLWDGIEVTKDESGNVAFVLKLMLFDLDRFEIIQQISVREFSVDHLGYYESTNKEMSEDLQSLDKNEEDYKEVVSEFIADNLCSIYFDDNHSFWVSFRGGVVRNITFDGRLSPLLVTASMPNSTTTGVFEFLHFHSSIDSVVGNSIILHENDEAYRMIFSEDELTSNQKIIAKEIFLKEPLTIHTSTEEKVDLEESNKVVLHVSNLDSEQGYLDALDQMIELSTSIDEIKSGHLLQFRIKDQTRYEEDELFFKTASKIKGATEKIAQIIKNFISYKGASKLYCNDETTALAPAVYYLTTEDEKYIDLAIQYLAIIDFEHDVYNKEKLIPLLRDQYHENHGQHIVNQLSKLNEGEGWLEGYNG